MRMTRNTAQREAVLNTTRMLDHPSADEVYEAVCKKHSTISRGTVYRNLAILSDEGKLRRIAGASGAARYDWRLENHYHLQCRHCGKLFDISMPYFDRLEERIPDDMGFVIEGHEIVFTGLCPDCKEKEPSGKPEQNQSRNPQEDH